MREVKTMSKKTHSGAKKRFKVTGGGKVVYHKAGAAHLKSRKNAKRTRRLKKAGLLHGADAKNIKNLLNK